MQMLTRAFTSGDYPALVALLNAAWPAYPTTEEQLLRLDEMARRHPDARFQRYIVEHAGSLVAAGHYEQPPRFYESGRFWVQIFVHPDFRRQGLGSLLYQRLIDDLRAWNAHTAWTRIREDMLSSVQFVEKHGFCEETRIWELHLEVAPLDPAPYAELPMTLRRQGIEIYSLRELEHDPERNQKLYDLVREVGQDLPVTERWSLPDYEDFQKELMNRSPEAYFIAIHEGHYVGLSYLAEHRAQQYCTISLTGVRRAYRRQGIALALKLRGIAYARQEGYAALRTNVASTNEASLAVNERLGFVKQPAWIIFTRDIRL